MDERAPAVVAVVVTTGAAPGLEATLSTLVSQDYAELSLLVVANGGDENTVARVAAVAPQAFVKVLEDNRGFSAACNEAALMVQGAAFLVFCHDDILFFEGAVSRLVESAYRMNAGIVTPKMVAYDDYFILLHVGQTADRFGAIRERVEIGEIDHGQQDLERDVFVAPGGVTLVRTDLFETLGGFDPLIPAMGEDLDLSWRAQVAGARIVVAPSAVVAHRQTLATGERPLTVSGVRRSSRRDLQRRHQLATVLTCWGWRTLVQVVPLLWLLDGAELVLSLVGRDRQRARAITGSWGWAWAHRRQIRQRRRDLGHLRVLTDAEIARLQEGGASRLRTFVTTLLQDGLDRARGVLPETLPHEDSLPPHGLSGLVTAFSEDEAFDEIEAIDAAEVHRRWARLFAGGLGQVLLIAVAAVVWFYGARDLVSSALPNIGRLAPLDSWWGNWRHLFGSWSSSGVGNGTPGMPGYGVIAFAGTFVLGRMGVLPKAVLILAVPTGALLMFRALRDVMSNRARLFAAIAYLALPIGVNLVAGGRIDVLVVSALLPAVLRRVFVLLNVPSFRSDALDESVSFGHRGWGQSRQGQITVLVLLTALMTAMAPAAIVVVAILIVGLVIGSVLLRETRLDRPWVLLTNVVAGVVLLLLPMTFDTLASGTRTLSVFGLAPGPWTATPLAELLRGAVGSFGFGWGGWVVPGIAAASLLVARGVRRQIAVMAASVALVALLATVLVERHLMGGFAPDPDVLLVLVGAMSAVMVGVTASALENDFAGSRFGGRQVLAGAVVIALVVAVVPWWAEASGGRYGLPTVGTPSELGQLPGSRLGGYRVLWLGEPSALPLSAWSVEPGLAAALTTNGLPGGATLFVPPDVGAAQDVLQAVTLAIKGQTVRLGQLLAPAGVSTVVVMTSSAPSLTGVQQVASDPPPAAVIPALEHQGDLEQAGSALGAEVFTNADFHGILSERYASLSHHETSSNPDSASGFLPVLDPSTNTGTVGAGTVLAGVAPASAFELVENGRAATKSTSLNWATTFRTPAGTATLVLRRFPLNALLATLTLLMWVAILLGFGALETLETLRRRSPRRVRVSPTPLDSEGGDL
jgi:GT2 family glycosyltransferase